MAASYVSTVRCARQSLSNISCIDICVNSLVDDSNNLTYAQWMVVLRLLTMWRFTASTRNVLERLRTFADPITKILLSQQYMLDAEVWLVPSVLSLARRTEPLTDTEGAVLGGMNAVKIGRVRESFSCCCNGGRQSQQWGTQVRKYCEREAHDFTPLIRSTFGISHAFDF